MAYIGFNGFESVDVGPDILDMFSDARTNVVLGSSIFAYLMTSCEYFFTNDIPMAASVVHDDRNIVLFNPEFFSKVLTSKEERAFVLVHELDHIFFGHQAISTEMCLNHDIFNKATDYFINLQTSGFFIDESGRKSRNLRYEKYFKMPACGLIDQMFLGWDSMKIYEHLLQSSNSSGSASDKSGDGGGFDIILGNGGTPSQGLKNLQSLQAAATGAMIGNTGIGSDEGNIIRRIQNMMKPVVVWTDRILATLRASVKIRPTYNRISNRSSGNVIFPSYTGERINVVFGVDTSGSMGEDDFSRAAGELCGVLEQFDCWRVHLVSCDTHLSVVGVYNKEDGDTINMADLPFVGGGGTDMAPIAEYATELSLTEDVDAVIIVTDGYIVEQTLSDAFTEATTNIVVSTRNEKLRVEHAEVIYVKQ